MKLSELAARLAKMGQDPEVVVAQGDARFQSQFVTVYQLAFIKHQEAAEDARPLTMNESNHSHDNEDGPTAIHQ